MSRTSFGPGALTPDHTRRSPFERDQTHAQVGPPDVHAGDPARGAGPIPPAVPRLFPPGASAPLPITVSAPSTTGARIRLRRCHERSPSSCNTAMNASCGISTDPTCFIRFFPSFWRSSSLRLRVMSPP